MPAPFTPPEFNKTAFHCPHCQTFAMQLWYETYLNRISNNKTGYDHYQDIESAFFDTTSSNKSPELYFMNSYVNNDTRLFRVYTAVCSHCEEVSIWLGQKQLYPFASSAPPPNPDLPDDLRIDYEEARAILAQSPRGAAALLRLVIQKLCKELGETGENINDDIGKLVSKGLDRSVADVMDSVRVIGNNAVHPGQMDISDDSITVNTLFELINMIVEKMITDPKRIKEIWSKLPKQDQEKIMKRDAKNRRIS